VLAHLGGAGGAVEADQVQSERLQRGQRRADLRAHQHGAVLLDRDLADQHGVGAGGGDGPLGAHDRGLGLQRVLAGLDQDGLHAAGDQARGVALVGVAELGVGDVAQGGELGAGAHGPDRPARPLGRGVGVGDLAGDARPRLRELLDPFGDVVLAQVAEVGAEGVGLDTVDAGVEVGLVHGAHDVGTGDVEDLVAALVPLEVVQGGVLRLKHRPHRPVGHDDAFCECLAERSWGWAHAAPLYWGL
jgi:hypothetical protein